MKNKKTAIVSLALFSLLQSSAFAEKEYFVQLSASVNIEELKKDISKKITDDELRSSVMIVDRNNGFYAAYVSAGASKEQADAILKSYQQYYENAFLKKEEMNPSKIMDDQNAPEIKTVLSETPIAAEEGVVTIQEEQQESVKIVSTEGPHYFIQLIALKKLDRLKEEVLARAPALLNQIKIVDRGNGFYAAYVDGGYDRQEANTLLRKYKKHFKKAYLKTDDMEKSNVIVDFANRPVESVNTEEKGKAYNVSAHGEYKPLVKNTLSISHGTPKNRRVKTTMVPFVSSYYEKEIPFGEMLYDGEIYQVSLEADFLYPLDKVYDFTTYLYLPDHLQLFQNGTTVNGVNVDNVSKENGFVKIVSNEVINANQNFIFNMILSATGKTVINNLSMISFAKTQTGKTLTLFKMAEKSTVEVALNDYLHAPEDIKTAAIKSPVEGLEPKKALGFVYPENNIVQSRKFTQVTFNVPQKSAAELLLNNEIVSPKSISEVAIDKKLGVKTITYHNVPLSDAANTLKIVDNGQVVDQKVITITGDIDTLELTTYPEKPIADGRTPIYVVAKLKDNQDQLITKNSYLKVYVDKGDIWDKEEEKYKQLKDDAFAVRVIGGKAVIKLSPAKTSESRRVTLLLGDTEKYIDVQFYPEIRPWIVAGVAEAGYGFGEKLKNDPVSINEEPFDHLDDDSFDGRVAFFTKGTLLEKYTLTAQYDSKKETYTDSFFENTPSTEEGEFYPVYGDSSEQFMEAKSQDKFFIKLEQDLSYIMHGDYNTDFGRGLEYNVYNRTFNGEDANIEVKDNYKIKVFHANTRQDIIKEEQEGRGISGPYFLQNVPIEHSEKIYVEIRDRYHPEQVVERRTLNRYTDYTVNYDEGWVIFNAPIAKFDTNFNPIFIETIYEADTYDDKQHIYGIRAEKNIIDNLKVGISYVKEEHNIQDKEIRGADIVYDDNKNFKAIAEIAQTKGFDGITLDETKGTAKRAEVQYRGEKNAKVKAFYSEVDDQFQNPSSTTAIEDTRTYGLEAQRSFGSENNTTLRGKGYRDETATREHEVYEADITHNLTDKFSVTAGARHIKEDINDTLSVTQGVLGVNYRPTENWSFSAKREHTFGDEETEYYPTRTSANILYKITEFTNAALSYELQERADQDVSLFSAGIDSRLTPNTTAFSKYTIDDSVSGFRTQSHLGATHRWMPKEGLTVSFTGENVQTLKGTDTEDYTAASVGVQYLKEKDYKLSGRYEHRFNEKAKDERLIQVGAAVKTWDEYTLFLRERYFESLYDENDLLVGLAYRPVTHDMMNYLFKLRHNRKKGDNIDEEKLIGSWHFNYHPLSYLTFMGEYAFKLEDNQGFEAYTDLIRARILWDVTDYIDAGVHAALLRQHETNTYTLAWGPEVGARVYKDAWVSVGYNFNGFYDDDFEEANYWSKGAYAKFRWKFDEDTFGLNDQE